MRALIGFKRVVFAAVAAMGITASAKTLYVSPLGDGSAPQADYATGYATIAEAVAAAEDGDVVQLGIATFELSESVTIDKKITVCGVHPELTTIHAAAGDFRAFTLNHADAVLERVTITGFSGEQGAAVYFDANGGTFRDSKVKSCNTNGLNGDSGAVWIGSAAALVQRCTITSCWGMWGGALFVNADGRVESCLISNCGASWGAGLYIQSGGKNPTFVNVSLTGNRADKDSNGHDVYNYSGALTTGGFYNCHVGSAAGGGLGGANNHFGSVAEADLEATLRGKGAAVAGASTTDVDGFAFDATPPIGCHSFNGFTGEIEVEIEKPVMILTDQTAQFSFTTEAAVDSVQYALFDSLGTPVELDMDEDGTATFTTTGTYGDYWCMATVTSGGSTVPFVRRVFETRSQVVHVSPNGSCTPPYDTAETALTDLQTAIDNVCDNGEIILDDGDFAFGATVVVTKPVTIHSANGRGAVSVSGEGKYRPFTLNHRDAVLDGLAVCNGLGGGVQIDAAGGVVDNCLIENCSTSGSGSAVVLASKDAHVRRTIIRNCTATGYGAAYFTAKDAGATLESCLVINNKASYGGGIYVESGATAVILNSTVVGNTATSAGGDLYLYGNVCAVTNSIISAVHRHATHKTYTTCKCRDSAQFVDMLGGDYTPVLNDLAVDGGVGYEGMVPTDVYGRPRVSGAAVDIGAAEYQKADLMLAVGCDEPRVPFADGVSFTLVPEPTGAAAEDVTVDWKIFCGKGPTVALEQQGAACEPLVFTPTQPGAYSIEAVAHDTTGHSYTFTAEHFVTAGGEEVFVDVNGADRWPYATAADAARNLEDAWAQTAASTTVHVAAGTYEINAELKLMKGMRLEGAGRDQTVIRLKSGLKDRVAEFCGDGAAIAGCTLSGGRLGKPDGRHGCGVKASAKNALIEDCRITDCSRTDSAIQHGGALAVGGSCSAVVRRTAMDGNTAVFGGAFYNDNGGRVVFDNCLMTGNAVSDTYGAGCYFENGSSGAMTNCTVALNVGGNGQIYFYTGYWSYSIVNTLAVAKPGDAGVMRTGYYVKDEFLSCFSFCGFSSVRDGYGTWASVPEENGNVTATTNDLLNVATYDCHLAKKSPLASAGHFEPWMKTATDLAGNPRANGKRVSIGCYQQGLKGLMILVQ